MFDYLGQHRNPNPPPHVPRAAHSSRRDGQGCLDFKATDPLLQKGLWCAFYIWGNVCKYLGTQFQEGLPSGWTWLLKSLRFCPSHHEDASVNLKLLFLLFLKLFSAGQRETDRFCEHPAWSREQGETMVISNWNRNHGLVFMHFCLNFEWVLKSDSLYVR